MSDTVNENGKRPHADDEELEIKEADAPFNASSADFILRASDNVDFRVHKVILSVVSPVFESMFTLPNSKSDVQESKDGLHVLACPESSTVLDPLLRFCYPTATPTLTELTILMPLYDAIDKYCMEPLLKMVEGALISAVDQNPMVAYAFGCRHHLQPVITAAAKASLNTPIEELPFCPDLERITAAQLFRLHEYHRACRKVASVVPKRWVGWLTVADIPLAGQEACQLCRTPISSPSNAVSGVVYDEKAKKWTTFVPSWCWDYLTQLEEELKSRPRGSTATDDKILDKFLRRAAECSNADCRPGIKGMLDFSQKVARRIEDILDTVSPDHVTSKWRFTWLDKLTHTTRSTRSRLLIDPRMPTFVLVVITLCVRVSSNPSRC